MPKVIIIVSFVFAARISFAQKTFSECYDTLRWKLTHSRAAPDMSVFTQWNDCIKGKEMPLLSLKTISGEKIETKDLKGKVMVFNLWFTTCHPCIAELPALNKLVNEYKHKNDFKIIPGAGDIVEKIGQTGFPTTYIVDANGKVMDAWIGGSIGKTAETAAYLRAKPVIDELLKAK